MSDLAQKIEMSSLDDDGAVVKTVTKKLLKTMTISALKAMISKLFKIEVLAQELEFKGLDDVDYLSIDEDHRQLSFFGIAEGGKLIIRRKK